MYSGSQYKFELRSFSIFYGLRHESCDCYKLYIKGKQASKLIKISKRLITRAIVSINFFHYSSCCLLLEEFQFSPF